MERQGGHFGKTVFWGAATAALYAAIFNYADLLMYMAHTTPDACVVGSGPGAIYYHRLDAAACAAHGGQLEPGTWWHVLPIILIAFAVSYVHGAFTGLFWGLMGLKPAAKH